MTIAPEDPRVDDEAQTRVVESAKPFHGDRPVLTRDDACPGDPSAPCLADGIELIGEYEDSGFKEAPHIARRADGQVIQLAPLLYSVAELANGQRGHDEIAEGTSRAIGRTVSADNVRFLVEKKLRPLGVLQAADGSQPDVKKADPLLALKFRAALVPDRAVRAVTSLLRPLFFPPVIVTALAGLVALDGWLFFVHGVGQSTRALVYNPALLLMVFGLVVVATAWHEFGHATAARYGGAEPGVMGAGVYIVWPAFYTDVTDAYRLGRWGRVRTDLGGVYFNGLFVLAVFGAYFATGFEPLLILVLVQHMQVIQQMLPFLRLDGYYVLSDLTGVPDMFLRMKPILQSLVPWRENDGKVEELKPWVRVAITAWVVLLVPVLGFIFAMMAFNAPRIFATAYDSFLTHWHALGEGGAGHAAVEALQMAMITLPAVGMVYSFSRIGKRAGAGAWRWSGDSPVRRVLVLGATGALAAGAAWIWWPNGEYRPIQPGEKGTIRGGIEQLDDVTTGRPGLTHVRRLELKGAPTRRDLAAGGAGADRPAAGKAADEKASGDGKPEDAAVPAGAAVTGDSTPVEEPASGAADPDTSTDASLSESDGSPDAAATVDAAADPAADDPSGTITDPSAAEPAPSSTTSSPPPATTTSQAPPAETTTLPAETTTDATTTVAATTTADTTTTPTTPTTTTTP